MGLAALLTAGLAMSTPAEDTVPSESPPVSSDELSGSSELSAEDRVIWFDASLSSISYRGAVDEGGGGIPDESGVVWYTALSEDGSEAQTGRMIPAFGGSPPDVSSNEASMSAGSPSSGTDSAGGDRLYYVRLPAEFSLIRFGADETAVRGNRPEEGRVTETQKIDFSLQKPCFFASPRDPAVYDGGYVGGYWTEAGTVYDPKSVEGKELIPIKTGDMGDDSSVIYLSSDFYDYYTDFELTGSPVRDYPQTADDTSGSHRSYLRYRAFNQAASDYYREHTDLRPIYLGHFQPEGEGSCAFSGSVAESLSLFGYEEPDAFFSENNSMMDLFGTDGHYADAARGLVPAELSSMESPYFNEAFLAGANSRRTVLGETMKGVLFPFTQRDQEDIDGNPTGVREWSFDSSKTTLHLAVDGSRLFLKTMRDETADPDGTDASWSDNIDSAGFAGSPELSSRYGFFPLNDTSVDHNSFHYNFGFGTRIDIPFTVPDNGNIEMTDGSYVPQTFSFSGDDDVWVYIDGRLVLDVGGQHGRVSGCINFSEDFPFSYCYDTKSFPDNRVRTESQVPAASVFVSGTKADPACPDDGGPAVTSFDPSSLYEGRHTLTMYYLERGMWESNLSVAWSIVPEATTPSPEPVVLPDTGSRRERAWEYAVAALLLAVASTTVSMRIRPDKDRKWHHEFTVTHHPGIRVLTKFVDFLKKRKKS